MRLDVKRFESDLRRMERKVRILPTDPPALAAQKRMGELNIQFSLWAIREANDQTPRDVQLRAVAGLVTTFLFNFTQGFETDMRLRCMEFLTKEMDFQFQLALDGLAHTEGKIVVQRETH